MPTHSSKYILAIDLGTSGPKVGLVSIHGKILACEFESNKLLLLPDGGAEQDPDDWWNAIKVATRRLLAKRLIPVKDIVALSCTTQWAGTVAVNERGRHLMNAVIWMDSRGARYIKQITGGFLEIDGTAIAKMLTWLRVTGGLPGMAGKDPIAHIIFIKNEHPQIYAETFKFLEPKDYLNMRLTGKCTTTYESICLHWVTDNRDISNITYHQGLLKTSHLEREKLPDLIRAVDILGTLKPEVANELGLHEGVQVVAGTPDIQSAAIGSGAVRDYEANLYIGTSSWLTCHVPYKKTDVFHNMASLPSAIPEKYLLTNEQECAGACLTYLRDNILYPEDDLSTGPSPENFYDVINNAAGNVPAGSDCLIFTPWLYGERAPVDDHLVRGGFFNQSLQTTREHVLRAVFEGVGYNSRWLLKYVERFIKKPLQAINMVGGGAQSDLWCQIHADILNRTIKQIQDPIWANLRGAAFLASVALGHISFSDIPDLIQIDNIYEPNPQNRHIYDELFEEFVNLYKRTAPVYSRLNKTTSRV